LTLRDQLGVIFQDEAFLALFPVCGQPGLPPWRLALVTILPFRATLADRQAAEAVRARIDWTYLRGLELSEPGCACSVLSECRERLLAGRAEALLFAKLLERCRAMGLLTARGQQRTDSTPVWAARRVLNRLELVAETLRAALNKLATVAPAWRQALVPPEWYARYAKRIADARLPREPAQRAAYAQTVGEDGFALLDMVEAVEAPPDLRTLPSLAALRRTWQRHYERTADEAAGDREHAISRVQFRPNRDWPPAAEGSASPYDPEARYRHKRDTQWTGSMVHVSDTCEPTPHLLTHVHTTPATVHEAQCTAPIQQALVATDVPPRAHLVDAASIAAERLVDSREEHGIIWRGPTRPTPGGQAQVEGAYTIDQLTVDWERQVVTCPQGKCSAMWAAQVERQRTRAGIIVACRTQDCAHGSARSRCTRAESTGRRLHLPPPEPYAALQAARTWYASQEGRQRYKCRAGIDGTLSQGGRALGLRRTR
jgi:transposase